MNENKKRTRIQKSKSTKVKNKVSRHLDFDVYLQERLQDPNLALLYLNEAASDEDIRVFLLALKHVLIAQGGDMTAIAEQAKLNRQNLYRMLSAKGNPTLTSLRSLTDVLGLQINFSFKNR